MALQPHLPVKQQTLLGGVVNFCLVSANGWDKTASFPGDEYFPTRPHSLPSTLATTPPRRSSGASQGEEGLGWC